MLALAYLIERQVESGVIKDYATAARLLGITRARMTQIHSLLNLAPAIQEALLDGRLKATERQLRTVLRRAEWKAQERRAALRGTT